MTTPAKPTIIETNWGFKVFDPGLLTEFSKSNFRDIIKRALYRSIRGKAKLTGSGDLVRLYPYLESEANENGVAGIIKWGGKLMMVPVSGIEKKDGKSYRKYFFKKNPHYQQYTNLVIKLPLPKLDLNGNIIGDELIEHTFYADNNHDRDKLFAILENDVKMDADLEGVDEDLDKLAEILDAIFHDITLSKKKIYFVFPQDPSQEEWAKVNAMWNNGIMGYIALPKSAQDTGKDTQGGFMKEGIDPDKIELKVYQPENKGRDLWLDYHNFMKLLLWKYGIRFDVLENKEERAPVNEVKNSSSHFDNIDNERKQCRLNFISWVKDNWGGEYNLTYGNN
jgi:hypothetical protein